MHILRLCMKYVHEKRVDYYSNVYGNSISIIENDKLRLILISCDIARYISALAPNREALSSSLSLNHKILLYFILFFILEHILIENNQKAFQPIALL